jgi:hypothetical protein
VRTVEDHIYGLTDSVEDSCERHSDRAIAKAYTLFTSAIVIEARRVQSKRSSNT